METPIKLTDQWTNLRGKVYLTCHEVVLRGEMIPTSVKLTPISVFRFQVTVPTGGWIDAGAFYHENENEITMLITTNATTSDTVEERREVITDYLTQYIDLSVFDTPITKIIKVILKYYHNNKFVYRVRDDGVLCI